jgi:hypothetical protein
MDHTQTRDAPFLEGTETAQRQVGGPPVTLSERVRQEERSAKVVAGGSMAEVAGGIAAVVLAILGLASVYPTYMGPIAAIVTGAALLLYGGSVAARSSRLLREIGDTGATESELGGGVSAELLGGAAGIALGILALANVAPLTLMSVAAVVFGGAILLGCAANRAVNYLRVERWSSHPVVRQIAGDLVATANGAQVLVGLGAITLGIIALTGIHPLTLSLVPYLAVGAAVGLSGSAVGGKMFSMLSGS